MDFKRGLGIALMFASVCMSYIDKTFFGWIINAKVSENIQIISGLFFILGIFAVYISTLDEKIKVHKRKRKKFFW